MRQEEIKTRIAQTHLKDEGLYKLKVDGDWGPASRKAALEWWRKHTLPQSGSPYELAQKFIGEKEIAGSRDNPEIVGWLREIAPWVEHDETAWCSAFVNSMASLSGYEHTDKLNARSWLDAGVHVELENARPGDVVIFWRSSPSSWKGHVGFFVSHEGSYINTLGGNQANRVSIANYPENRLLGVRRLRKDAA